MCRTCSTSRRSARARIRRPADRSPPTPWPPHSWGASCPTWAKDVRTGLRPFRGWSILNQMVQYPAIDRTLAALADPTRRSVLERLGRGSATITELAEPAGISLTGMKKQVRLLEEAGLVSPQKVGRPRRCSAGPRRLDDATDWIDTYRQML